MRGLIAAGLALLLGGCVRAADISASAIEHNKAVADTANQLVLLNVVRASLRHPIAYTQMTGVSEQLSNGPSGEISVPFGPDAFKVYSLTAGFSSNQYASISTAPLEDQEFYAGVMTPMTLEIMKYFLDSGWPTDLIYTVFVENFEVTEPLYRAVIERSNAICKPAPQRIECTRLLADPIAGALRIEGGFVVDNDPRNAQRFATFQDFLQRLQVLGIYVEQIVGQRVLKLPASTQLAASGDQINGLLALGASVQTVGKELVVTVPYVNHALRLPKLSDGTRQVAVLELAARLRSPDAVLFYLGETVSGARDGRGVVEVHVGSGDSARFVPLFHIEETATSGAVVSVEYRGHTYAVADGDSARTMQVMALVHQIFGLHKRAYAPPQSLPVTVIN